jgi:DNA-directed RNA polymerase subunit RPC12/RpoP
MYKISLAQKSPKTARCWHPTRNGSLQPTNVGYRSKKSVWWLCPKGHEYKGIIFNKAKTNNGSCPYCSGKKVAKERTLAVVFPEIAKEWHHKKNGDLSPDKVLPQSGKKVWWSCPKKHEYQAILFNRTRKTNATGCPYCSGRKATKSYNLARCYKRIAAEWDYVKNGDLTPDHVLPFSSIKVWWRCKKGHSWKAVVSQRVLIKTNCPFCSGRYVTPEKSLEIKYPYIAQEWDYTKNLGLTPKDVLPHSNKKVWWRCHVGHRWSSSIDERTQRKQCPKCYRNNTIKHKRGLIKRPPIR